jgi:hypothetical protein
MKKTGLMIGVIWAGAVPPPMEMPPAALQLGDDVAVHVADAGAENDQQRDQDHSNEDEQQGVLD